jgi:protein-disulfide isomerase
MRIIIIGLLAVAATAANADDQPVAIVGDRAITRAEVEGRVKTELFEIENSRYAALREGLDEILGEALIEQEAKARGISVAELEKVEITDKAPEPSEQRINELLERSRGKLGDATPESVKPQLVAFLRIQYAQVRRQNYIEELQGKYKTKIFLRPPTVDVGTGSVPPRGNAQAAVTIVEFADYECPYCKQAADTVKQVLDTYGDQVRFAYRDFPLDMHPNARPAAEAAHCAGAQGKFWEYHDQLFASSDLSATRLDAVADELGLDRKKFDACMNNDTFVARIDKDLADGSALGIDGTPVFYVNGRLLDGAQPFEKFKEIIDEELSLAKQGG